MALKFSKRVARPARAVAMSRRAPLAFGFAAVIGFSTLAVSAAHAQEGVFMKNLLGKMGVIDEERDPISYHERAPLALPPSTGKLPTPLPPAARRAESWPDDADLQRRRREAAERQKPVPFPSDNRVQDGGRLSVYEMERISRKPKHAAEDNQPRKVLGDGRAATWVDPDELRATATDGDGKNLDPNYEPKRETLLQPPTGYRKPAGTAPMRATRDDAPIPIKRDNTPERDFLKPSED